MKKKVIIVTFIIVLLILVLIYSTSSKLQATFYTVESSKINSEIKIVLISDLHGSYFGKEQEQIINAIDKVNPDLVFLTGDIFDEDIDYKGSELLLKEIGVKYKCYYVTGNHEYWTNQVDEIKEKVRNYSITVLEGQTNTINVNGQLINISGLDDLNIGEEEWLKQIDKCGEKTEENTYSILLTHRPELIDIYEHYDFDLILSGHAHGGQVRIPIISTGLYAPNQGWFPKYISGKYLFNNTTMIVSRGLSKKVMSRFFNRPELVVLSLKS